MNYFKVQNSQLYFLDEGAGETIVIVHGTPANSSEYQAVIQRLSNDFRCVALDHLGFGKSDKPEFGDYSIQSHQERLVALLNHLELRTFHLLVHDFGGVIGLPLVSNQDFEIKSVTILNSWMWPLIETEPQMKHQKWLLSSGIFPFLYRYFNFSAKVLIKFGWGKKNPLSVHRHRSYIEQFQRPSQRNGTIGFLRTLFDFDNPCWHRSDVIAGLKKVPLQIIWGKSDKVISTRTLERWKSVAPDAKVCELEDVGHFVAEESPDEVAARLQQFAGKIHSEASSRPEQNRS
jgi:pimeloyl-ACP methyl ester carboxylesterase